MKYLLDTHAFLWFIAGDERLSTNARALIENDNNQLFLSLASIWEMAIKKSLGRLILPEPFADFIIEQISVNGFHLLGITFSHVSKIGTLPFHHRDPFDRLIVCQSITENLPVISKDQFFSSYDISCHW